MELTKKNITGCNNLLAAIINDAVDDFNKGTVSQQLNAGSFFRNDAKWMCNTVGATVDDLTKHRLERSPYDHITVNNKPRKRYSPAEIITWDGQSKTILEWSLQVGVTTYTIRDRIKAHGVCDKVFRPGRLSAGVKKITWQGETMTIPEWSVVTGIKNDTLRSRIKKYGVCDMIFQKTLPAEYYDRVGRQSLKLTWDGKTMTVREWAKLLNISVGGMFGRYYKFGMTAKTFKPMKK